MKKNTNFFSLLSGLNELVEVCVYAYLCDNQQKKELRQYSMSRISPKMNVVLRKYKTKMDLASYHHVSLFSPRHSTLEHAIKNNHLTSWPGLTRELIVKKYQRYSLRQKTISRKKKNLHSTNKIYV